MSPDKLLYPGLVGGVQVLELVHGGELFHIETVGGDHVCVLKQKHRRDSWHTLLLLGGGAPIPIPVSVPILYHGVSVTRPELSTLLKCAKIHVDAMTPKPVSIPQQQYQYGVSVTVLGLSTLLVLAKIHADTATPIPVTIPR